MPAKTKVVVAFLDGRRLKGFLFDFSPVRGYFFLFPESDPALESSARGLLVRLSELTPGVAYEYHAASADLAGNPSSSSPDLTFTARTRAW